MTREGLELYTSDELVKELESRSDALAIAYSPKANREELYYVSTGGYRLMASGMAHKLVRRADRLVDEGDRETGE